MLAFTAVLTWPKSSVPGERSRMHCTPSPVSVKLPACGSLVAAVSGPDCGPVTTGENDSVTSMALHKFVKN